jgi:hypothetical protein
MNGEPPPHDLPPRICASCGSEIDPNRACYIEVYGATWKCVPCVEALLRARLGLQRITPIRHYSAGGRR